MSELDRILAGLPQKATLEFFATFARFEYALMYSNYLKSRSGRAEADWGRLAEDLGEGFFAEANATGRTPALISDPPKKLIVRGNRAKFGGRPEPIANTVGLLAAAKQVRNNLFHGNKMFASDRDRDVALMLEVLWLLENIMSKLPKIRSAFDEPQH